jgi:two-component system NtrC family sensor kinase
MIEEAISLSEPRTKEGIRIEQHGNTRHIDITVYPLHSLELTGAVIRVDDVTVRQKLDSMMLQNEKLKSLGELAAGMAHEINNPLAAILQSLQNVERRLDPEQAGNQAAATTLGLDMKKLDAYLEAREIKRFLDGMDNAGRRAAEIVRNMLEFSRSSSRQLEPTQLNDVAHASVNFMRNAIEFSMPALSERLAIEEDYDSSLPILPASGTELQQVLVNLLKNAAQAIQEAKRETPLIRISTRYIPPLAEIRVEDNGTGMSLATSKQIFDPFFTTKVVGQGTGLGLSISHFIITQRHHGRIEVRSVPDKGTTFIITLPIAQPGQSH